MVLPALLLTACLFGAVPGQEVPRPGADGRYTISAPGIRAQFIPYGATLTNLFVNDKDGKEIDVVLGYDDAAYYPKDPSHPTYNSIPGRYANRIGKATFSIDGKTFRTQRNDGQNTLHSGTNNWSYRVWNVTAVSASAITFSLTDRDGESTGMPGRVDANVTYTVANSTWSTRMVAVSDTRTPLMLTHHTYFNLDAYRNPSTPLIWEHTLAMPSAKRFLAADSSALPTGQISTAPAGSVNDFYSKPGGAPLGHARNSAAFRGNCGGGCDGYNGFWIFDEGLSSDAVVLTLASAWSGVRAELSTNQVGVVEKSSCIAVEPQDYIDGINRKEWNRTEAQITGPGETYFWESSWRFGTFS